MMNILEAICKDEGISLHGVDFLRKTQGVAMRDPDEPDTKTILYSVHAEGWSKMTIIAHEIAHHVLGHLDDGAMAFGDISNKTNPIRERNEQEAQVFATTFTACAMFFDYYKRGGVCA